jgi:hypothetical protein
MKSKKEEIIYVSLVSICIFLIVYSIHLATPFPVYNDEWFHLSKAIHLLNGEYEFNWFALEIGFHLFLALIGMFANLVLIYQFLPGIWAAVSAITLYCIIRKKTFHLKNSFLIAIFAMIFFSSIKSNVNIAGLWFFTPLTFSIPFIFLYVYFFAEGIEKQNKKMIMTSLMLMIFILFTHALSVLFALSFLFIYAILNYKFIIKEYKFFLLFLLIPIIGIIFYLFMMNLSIKELIPAIFNSLQFKYGWGVAELNNSPLELYSLTGYIFAFFGIFSIISMEKEQRKKYIAYLLWPVCLLISIIIFKLTKVSYISPYQRNLYYFAISLPFLSALGLSFVKDKMDLIINNFNSEKFRKIIMIFLAILIIFLCFVNYYNIPKGTLLYKYITKNDYNAIKFLSTLPESVVLSKPEIAIAVYPVSNQRAVTTSIYGKAERIRDIEEFFSNSSCDYKNEIIKKYNASYVLTRNETLCNWNLIYDKEDYVYET